MYLNVVEVESALAAATSAPYNGFTELITLPNLTWEGRQCHAVKIANGSGPGRPGVYFLGGIHSREWGSSDILINFVEQLEQAYHNSTGLNFGAKTFTPTDIQTIVNTLDIIVFPQANPDGRNYSMNSDVWWRKNRRTAAPNSALCTGVDVNRNYDFLWNFPIYFNVPASGISDSTDPCDYQLYNGPSAFSEPESSNAKWIFDTFPKVGFFVDIHSYGEDILYSWGDDEDQTSDPNMTFRNTAFDGMRGVASDAYKEYIPASDLSSAVKLAGALHDGIQALRGTDYTVKPSFNLYPTAGTSDDYAYSRHFVDPNKQNVLSYTLEWGAEFQPPYSEMQNIIQEITAGLLAFCLSVRKSLQRCTFALDRDHYGQDEIDALRTPAGAVVSNAFFVIVDGFAPAELGIVDASSLSAAPVVTFTPSTGVTNRCSSLTSDDPSFGPEVQRFRFGYDVDFGTGDSAFTSFPGATETVNLITILQGLPASSQVTFIKQPDPYILQGAKTWWLSSDIRFIQVATGDYSFGVPMGTGPTAPFDFLAKLTSALESGQGKAGNESFDDNVEEDNEIISVAPTTTRGGQTVNVYNFAIARVHYRGFMSKATSVRVFFRLFAANSTATDFQPGSTYKRYAAYSPTYPVPLANYYQDVLPTTGVSTGQYVSIPCFGEARTDPTQTGAPNGLPSMQTPDAFNVRTLQPTGSGPQHDTFYGCWLDINLMTPMLPSMPPSGNEDGPWPGMPLEPLRQAFIVNDHQCLVAEIAFDPDPINTGTQPWNSDKLAQRNISWSYVANPGVAASREAIEPFEIRPTLSTLGADELPDELMIDWTNVPLGQHAELYLPALDANAVLARATELYQRHRLTVVDANTIGCVTGGVSYIPVPKGSEDGANFVGLMSVNLPHGITKGQKYTVIVRQLTNASAAEGPPPRAPEEIAFAHVQVAPAPIVLKWRRVLGTFQINIPVSTKELLLPKEEQRLSIFRWIGEAMPTKRRWHPVFQRYLEGIARRVSGFGGDPTEILPSPAGEGKRKHRRPEEFEGDRVFTGKIAGLVFDRFGDFEGFVLDTEDGERKFCSREKEVEALAERAWRERLRITVAVKHDESCRPERIIVRRAPVPFCAGET